MVAVQLYRKWRLLVLIIVLSVVMGTSSMLSLGRQEDPTITNLFATIVTQYPGATPTQVEAQITEVIENELRGIPEIKEIQSTSKQSVSIVQIELSWFLDKADLEAVWAKVRDAVNSAGMQLPSAALPPVFDNQRAGSYTYIMAIMPKHEQDILFAHRYALTIQDKLRQLPDTERVDLIGYNPEIIDVRVDAKGLVSAGLSMRQLEQVIRSYDVKQSIGAISSEKHHVTVGLNNEFTVLDDIGEVPVSINEFGGILALRDVATIERSERTPNLSRSYVGNQRALFVAARMEPDKQVHRWSERVHESLRLFQQGLPDSLSVIEVFDQSVYTDQKLNELKENLLLGVLLVILVLLFTMGPVIALVVALVIPLSTLLSFVVFNLLNVTIHQMSISGLIVALGLLVDSAIVVTDDISKRLDHATKTEAIKQTVQRLSVPLTASTFTTVLAFLPMVLLPGPAGDFVGAIAVAVIVMLTASLLLSLSVTPAMAVLLLSRLRHIDIAQGIKHRIAVRFERTIALSTQYPLVTLITALILPLFGFALFSSLSPQFFPGVDRNQFHIEVEFAPSYSIENTSTKAQNISTFLKQEQGIQRVFWVSGQSFPSFYYNMRSTRDNSPEYAQLYVETTDAIATDVITGEIHKSLSRNFPEAQFVVRKLSQGPPVDAPVEIAISGPNLDTLRHLGSQLTHQIASVSDIVMTRSSLKPGAPVHMFKVNAQEARLVGLTPRDLANELTAMLQGSEVGKVFDDTVSIPVLLRAKQTNTELIETLLSTQIKTKGKEIYPEAIGAHVVSMAPGEITRRNGERVNTIQAFIRNDMLPDDVYQQIAPVIDTFSDTLPAGYLLTIGGDASERAETIRNLTSSLGIILSLFVLIIGVTFNSFRLSFIAIFVCGLSAGLSILSLAIFGFPFGIQAIIGLIGAIGVAVNAAIIILTALQNKAKSGSMTAEKTGQVVVDSSRHITSTTLTTFFGFLPLILSGGNFWPPFAIAIAGGVLLSTVISFYIVPSAYMLTHRQLYKRNTQCEGS